LPDWEEVAENQGSSISKILQEKRHIEIFYYNKTIENLNFSPIIFILGNLEDFWKNKVRPFEMWDRKTTVILKIVKRT